MQGSLRLESHWYRWCWSNLFRLTEAPENTHQKRRARQAFTLRQSLRGNWTGNDRPPSQTWNHFIYRPPFPYMRSFHTTEILWVLSVLTQGQWSERRKKMCSCYFSSEKGCFISTDLNLLQLLNSSLLRSHLDLEALFCAAEKSNHNSLCWWVLFA